MTRHWWPAAAFMLACGGETGPVEQFTVPRGASVTTVADTLAARGIISDAGRFRLYASLTRQTRSIKAGVYRLPRGAGTRRALATLTRGRTTLRPLLITEGLMLSEIATTVQRELGIPPDSVIAAAADSAIRARFGVTAPTVEGYLYPSTYMVPFDIRARDLVGVMTREFESRWRQAWNGRLDSLGMTRHELVILASIIEGEVRHPEDRRYVSSVYHNRLRRGMRLQADPTVIYALGRRRRLFERDYEVLHPYNTYQIDGLPPGPIGSPSVASFEAALYPASTDFLYFVARADGRHVFSRTFAEHRQAIQDIRNGG